MYIICKSCKNSYPRIFMNYQYICDICYFKNKYNKYKNIK